MITDAAGLPELTERQEKILSLIVREYTQKPEPVGSKFLAEQYLSNVSSATIRNDMAHLEALGLVTAPHTSAGRIPTEEGYRYFVRRLLAQTEGELPAEEKTQIANTFGMASPDMGDWLQLAVVTLARAAQGAALVTPPRALKPPTNHFKHVALITTQGRLVMMVLVLQGGEVRQQMLTLAEAVPQPALNNTMERLNQRWAGLSAEQIRAQGRIFDNALEREISELIADMLDDGERTPRPMSYRDGLTDVLREFTTEEGAEQAVRVIEARTPLDNIVNESLGFEIGTVRVLIGGEGRWDEVRHLGLVLGRYGVRGQLVGTMVVLGPTRMRYGRAVSAVGYVAGLVSDHMQALYGYEPEKNE